MQNDEGLVTRLRIAATDDHERGCQGRNFACSCGYDANIQIHCQNAANEIERLTKLVHVPGAWRCAKCNFVLIQSNLNAQDGTVTARDNPGDKCPNDGSPLWRVSYRDWCNEQSELAEQHIDRLRAELAAAKADRAGIVGYCREKSDKYHDKGYGREASVISDIADAIESGADRKDG